MDLPPEYNISSTFNIGNLTLYSKDTELRSILLEERRVEPCMNGSEKENQESSQHSTNMSQDHDQTSLLQLTNINQDPIQVPSIINKKVETSATLICSLLHGLRPRGTRTLLSNLQQGIG